MLKYLTILFLLLTVLAAGVTAQAAEQEIRSMLNERDAEIKELLGPKGTEYTQEQRDRLKDIINDVIDFREMASHALGDTYQEISDEKREEFISLFATIIRDNSLNRLDIYRADITYTDISVNGDSAHVQTIAQLENVRTPVEYDMQKKNGEWLVVDIWVDQVSTAASYHRQFQSIIRQRGFEALLQSLQRRADRAAS